MPVAQAVAPVSMIDAVTAVTPSASFLFMVVLPGTPPEGETPIRQSPRAVISEGGPWEFHENPENEGPGHA
ncbi:hypothetical protein GCM10022252_01860 [Streptosporangium oxazolinicum]|uniref:Uncharacterized protein n=1 Tax=Streptosporangium oxazolinicum TaxID=909287 RepID=A0ABP8A8F4_9ACTN